MCRWSFLEEGTYLGQGAFGLLCLGRKVTKQIQEFRRGKKEECDEGVCDQSCSFWS